MSALDSSDRASRARATHLHTCPAPQLVAKELPPREFVQEVLAVAHAFWAERPNDYIAIHCAYGTAPRSCL